MRKRFLNLTLALGLVAGLFVGALGSASAETPTGSGIEWIFYPWVPNGETLDGAGPWYGTVTVQNIEDYAADIWATDTAGGDIADEPLATLAPHASMTFSASQLGLSAPGGGLAIAATWNPLELIELTDAGICDVATATSESLEVVRGDTSTDAFFLPAGQVGDPSTPITITYNGVTVPASEYTAAFNDPATSGNVTWTGTTVPEGGVYVINYNATDIIAGCIRGPEIGGVQKQVMATESMSGKTNSSHIAVDGYTAIPDEDVPWGANSAFCFDVFGPFCNGLGAYFNGIPVSAFDGHSYLPIVQTNTGWNSIIHITNIDASAPQFIPVTVTLYTAGGQGAAGTSVGEFTVSLQKGETVIIDLSAYGIPDGWVGSAWITSNYGVVANVNRVKPSADMAITNTAAPSLLSATSVDGPAVENVGELFEMYAPLVFQNYNGWNTGINVANVSELQNTVNVTFYGASGNVVGSDQVTIPAKGMEFIYIPSTGDIGLQDFVGAAVLSSTLPFHAAVDEVKYSTVEAMSYIATAAGAQWFEDTDTYAHLSLPLVQKGSPITGLGDTSGINLFNAAGTSGVTVWVDFYLPSGALAAPTLSLPYQITLGALNTATIYTMNLSEMSAGFQGSADIYPVSGLGTVVGVSNNVNYDVQGDGSTVFNLLNTNGQFRCFESQTSGFCGNPGL